MLVKGPGYTVFVVRVPSEHRKEGFTKGGGGDILWDILAPFLIGAYDAVSISFIGCTDGKHMRDGVDKKFYGISRTEFSHYGFAELNFLIRKCNKRLLLRIEQFGTGDFKTSHIEIPGFHLYLHFLRCGCGNRLVLFGLGVNTLSSLEIILIAKGCPPGIDDHKALQNSAVQHSKLRQIRFILEPGIIEHSLNRYKVISRYYGFVVIVIVALRTVPSVLHRLVCSEVRCERLSCNDVTAMPFITQYLHNATGCPLDVSKVGLTPKGNQGICNLLRGIAVEVHIKDEFYRGGFIGIDDKLSVCIVLEAEKLRCKRNTVVKAHTERGFHTTAPCVRLFLCHCGNEGKCHSRVIVQGENALGLKKYTNRVLQLGKLTHDTNTYKDVSC